MLVLASASPRRQELLRCAGISFTVQAANIDETPRVGEMPREYAERLARETLFPVAASKGIKGYANFPSSAHELLQYPLLNPYDEWERWFRRAGVIAPLPEAGRTFSDASALMAATERGVGVVLGRYWLVADALKAGTLVRLPGPAITASRTYYLIHPSGQPLTPNALTFVSWLRKVMTEKRT